MTEKINWNLNVQVLEGPKIQDFNTVSIDAYDMIDVTIEAKGEDKEVEIQPGGEGQVQFLLIKSDQYGDSLTYKVNDKDATNIIRLDAMQVFLCNGSVGFLGGAPAKLFFTNKLDSEEANIKILVGRKATKPEG